MKIAGLTREAMIDEFRDWESGVPAFGPHKVDPRIINLVLPLLYSQPSKMENAPKSIIRDDIMRMFDDLQKQTQRRGARQLLAACLYLWLMGAVGVGLMTVPFDPPGWAQLAIALTWPVSLPVILIILVITG